MTITKYTIGFILSILLTLIAYMLVVGGYRSPWLLAILALLAVVQMIVQLIYFLHLGDEVGPRYKLMSFLFMAGTLLIIVIGSLWIMQNMNYNMMLMSPEEKTMFMLEEHDKGF